MVCICFYLRLSIAKAKPKSFDSTVESLYSGHHREMKFWPKSGGLILGVDLYCKSTHLGWPL